MNNHKLIRHTFDGTGKNPNNLVKDEHHKLADKRFRAIAPKYGLVFADSVILIDRSNNRLLFRGTDYVFAELHQALTLDLGLEVCGVIIVTNFDVSSNVEMTYQCVGGHYETNADTMMSLFQKSADPNVSKYYYDIENRPDTFLPSPHMHDLGDVQGLEVVVYEIERIRNAILWSDSNAIESILSYVLDAIDSMTMRLLNRVGNEILALIITYKRNFTKAVVGLGNLANYGIATADEGRQVFNDDYQIYDDQENRYVTTEALTAFKEVLYSTLVSSEITQLGKSYGTLVRAKLPIFSNIPAGSTFIVESLKLTKSYNTDYDAAVYPSEGTQSARWAIMKVSEKTNNGSVLAAINMENGDAYTGDLRYSTSGVYTLAWQKHLNENDTIGYLDKLIKHIRDNSNPHKDTKKAILLGNVENLPVASKADIVCRKPVRKYITYDGLLLYAKAFLTGIKDPADIEQDDTDPNVLEQYQLIFAPCGPCGSLKTIEKKICDEKGKLLFSYCDDGAVKKAMYADGDCGTYTEVLKEKAEECGYVVKIGGDNFTMGWYRDKWTDYRLITTPYEKSLYNVLGNFNGMGEHYNLRGSYVYNTSRVNETEPVDDATILISGLQDHEPDFKSVFDKIFGTTVKPLASIPSFPGITLEDQLLRQCNFGVDDGFWQEGYTVELADSTSVSEGYIVHDRYVLTTGDETTGRTTVVNDTNIDNYKYSAEDAAIMNEIFKNALHLEYDASTGLGTVSWGDIILNKRYTLARDIETTAQLNSSQSNKEEWTKYFGKNTPEQIQGLLSRHTVGSPAMSINETNTNVSLTLGEFMLIMPTADCRLIVKDATGKIKGWLNLYQTIGHLGQLGILNTTTISDLVAEIERERGNYNFGNYGTLKIPIPLAGFDSWINAEAGDSERKKSSKWYTSKDFYNLGIANTSTLGPIEAYMYPTGKELIDYPSIIKVNDYNT